MTWIAPQVTRTEESFVADERSMLEGILERHRHNGHADLLREAIDGVTAR
jgi:hypothetical protein